MGGAVEYEGADNMQYIETRMKGVIIRSFSTFLSSILLLLIDSFQSISLEHILRTPRRRLENRIKSRSSLWESDHIPYTLGLA